MLSQEVSRHLVIVVTVVAASACGDNTKQPAGNGPDAGASGDDAPVPDSAEPLPPPFIVAPIIPDGGAAPQLFRMNRDGSGLQPLTTASGVGLPTDANDMPVISHDRQTIYFASGRDFLPSSQTHDHNPMYRMIWVMNADGTNPHRLTTNDPHICTEWPDDISPDGTWISFRMSCGNLGTLSNEEKLYRIHPDGTGQEMLVANDISSMSSTTIVGYGVFANNNTLVYRMDDSTAIEYWKVDLATLHTTKITDAASTGHQVAARKPMILPGDSHAMYYTTLSNDFSSARIEKVNLDGTGNEVVFDIAFDPDTFARLDDRFALSPEGDAFVFESGSDTKTVVTSSIDGTNRTTIYSSSIFIGWGDLAWR